MNPHSSRLLEAFLRAQNLYTQYLTAEERSRITTTINLSTLVTLTQSFGDELQRHGNYRGAMALLAVGQKALLLEPFEKLVEGAAKMSPVAGSMIWGSIIFLLEMAKNNTKVFDEVLKFFESFADEVGYMNLQNQTFVASPLVQSVMERLYVAVLNFWVAAVTYYRAKTGGLRGRIKTFVTASTIQKGFEMMKAEIAEQKIRLDNATTAEHNAQTSAFYASSDSFRETTRQRELKKWLNAPDYEQDLRAAKNLRYPRTCEWILRRQPYIEWVMLPSTPFLYIHGIPGSGKTVLSSWIINDLQTTHGTELVLYHYFKDTDANKCTPQSAVRSFIDQLHDYLRQKRNPLLSELESNMEQASLNRSGHVAYVDLWNLFSSSMAALASLLCQQSPLSHTIVFVMDAMDECQHLSGSPLIPDLFNLAQAHPDQIWILVTGRKSALDIIQHSLLSSVSSINELAITMEDVHEDIRSFVQHTICSIPRLDGHPALRDRLATEIGRASNHQGMFLWAYFMCEEVKRQGDPHALRNLLDHLPRGLDAMYIRICHSIIDKDDGLNFSLSVLQWLVNSPRPLRFAELQDALNLMRSPITSALSTRDPWFDKTSDLLWSRQDIVDACCNLVIYTGLNDGDSFRLVHLSATQFFRGNLGLGNHTESPKTTRFFIGGVRNAQFDLAGFCLQYLVSETLCSHKHSTLCTTHYPDEIRNSRNDEFLEEEGDFLARFPLFQFAATYWFDFVLSGLKAGVGSPVLPSRLLLDHFFKAFDSSPSMFVWLAHAIGLWGTGVLIDKLTQLIKIGTSRPSFAPITGWASKSVEIMNLYSNVALKQGTALIRRCWPMAHAMPGSMSLVRTWQIAHKAISQSTPESVPALPLIRFLKWMHHNSQRSLLLYITDDCLIVHWMFNVHPSVSTRILSPPSITSCLRLCAAAVSDSCQFVAAIFNTTEEPNVPHPVFFVCWRLPASFYPFPDNLDKEPELILCEHHITVLRSEQGRSRTRMRSQLNLNNYLAFLSDDKLVTPRGMWDLKKREWLPGSTTVFSSVSNIGTQCCSGDGRLIARIGDDGNQFNLFEIQSGTLLSKLKFSNKESLYPLGSSYSGQKMVFYRLQPTQDTNETCIDPLRCTGLGNQLSCLIVDDHTLIDLYTPYPVHIPVFGTHAQFSKNEENIVIRVTSCDHHNRDLVIIGLWNLIKDCKGQYTHASFMPLYKEWGELPSFCLAPALRHWAEPDILVTISNSALRKRPLNQLWSAEEEEALLSQNPDIGIKKDIISVDPDQKIITIKTLSKACNKKSFACLTKWSFASLPPHIITTSTCSLDVSPEEITISSPNAIYYLTTDKALLQVFDDNTAIKEDKQTCIPWTSVTHYYRQIEAIAVSTDGQSVAVLHHNGDRSNTKLAVNVICHDGTFFTVATSIVDLRTDPDMVSFCELHFNSANSFEILLTIRFRGYNQYEAAHQKSRGQLICAIFSEISEYGVVSTNLPLRQISDVEGNDPYSEVQFSACGRYLVFGQDIKEFDHAECLLTPSNLTHEDTPHPVIMDFSKYYVHHQCLVVLSFAGNYVELNWRTFPGEHKWMKQLICIVPDEVDTKLGDLHHMCLIWPKNEKDEVVVVINGKGGLFVIETGTLSGNLMTEEGQWRFI